MTAAQTSRPRRILWIGPILPAAESISANGSLTRVAGLQEALVASQCEAFDLAIASFPLEDAGPEEALTDLLGQNPEFPVFVLQSGLRTTDAVRFARLGAYQCLDSDKATEELETHVSAAVEPKPGTRETGARPCDSDPAWKRLLVGDSKPMQDLKHLVALVGPRRCTVLITGPTGTGKELLARALHLASPRGHLPMVAVNCAALPEHLLEAEFFGHVKGAFTGAAGPRVGRFEQAHNSTLFLDEIGDMPLDLQAKLLRVLQEREFQRLGSSETIQIDVRVIAATNMNLLQRVREGRFREDLYYRLNVVPAKMPALQERLHDLPLLLDHFLRKICRAEAIPLQKIGSEVIEALSGYSWPGNVRELENAVERALAVSGGRGILYPLDFGITEERRANVVSIDRQAGVVLPREGVDFEAAVNQFERALLTQALERTAGNKTLAAGLLGLKRTTLLAKLRAFEAQPAISSAGVA